MSAKTEEMHETEKRNLAEMCANTTRYLREAQALNAELLEALEAAKASLERECGINPGEGVGGIFMKINAAINKARN